MAFSLRTPGSAAPGRVTPSIAVAVTVIGMFALPSVGAAGSTTPIVTAVTSLVSVPSAGGSNAGASSHVRVDRDGGTAFASTAALSTSDSNGVSDIYFRTAKGTTELLSRTTSHHAANAASDEPALSADGRFIAFRSAATDLAASGGAPTAGRTAIYLYDRNPDGAGLDVHPSITMVSVTGGLNPVEANADSDQPAVADLGGTAYVAFRSASGNLHAGDLNGVADVFVHFGTTTDAVSAGPEIGQPSGEPTIAVTASDIVVAFDSTDTQLVANDTNGVEDVFARTIPLPSGQQKIELVSTTTAGTQGDGASSEPSISSDGNQIAFASMATNFAPTDTNGDSDVFVRNRHDTTTRLVSYADTDQQRTTTATGVSDFPAIAASGGWVAFESTAANITTHDTNGFRDVFISDLTKPLTQLLSRSTSGVQGTAPSSSPGIGSNGEFVAFESTATNLVTGDTNGATDAFLSSRDITAPHAPTATPDSAHPLNSTNWSHRGKVTITVSAADAASAVESGIAGYAYVWNHTKSYTPRPTENLTHPKLTKTLPTSAVNYFHVRAVDRAGNWGPTTTIGPFKIDTVAPKLSKVHFSHDGLSLSPHVRVTWKSSDDASGLKSFDIYLSHKTNTTGWTKFVVYKKGIRAKSYPITTTLGRDYEVMVRAHDKAGNTIDINAFREPEEIFGTPTPVKSLPTPSGWTAKASSKYYGGQAWESSTKGAKVTFNDIRVPTSKANPTLREVLGFVVTRCPTCGVVKLVASAPGEGSQTVTLNLHHSTTQTKMILEKEFGDDGNSGLYPTTVTVEVASRHKAIDIQGFGTVMYGRAPARPSDAVTLRR
jgi:hypothetical protein